MLTEYSLGIISRLTARVLCDPILKRPILNCIIAVIQIVIITLALEICVCVCEDSSVSPKSM